MSLKGRNEFKGLNIRGSTEKTIKHNPAEERSGAGPAEKHGAGGHEGHYGKKLNMTPQKNPSTSSGQAAPE